MSIDETYYPAKKTIPFDTIWSSQKFNGPAVRYETGVSNGTGRIIWTNSPFPTGNFPDFKIFKLNPLKILPNYEMVIADRGYTHARCITERTVSEEMMGLYNRWAGTTRKCKRASQELQLYSSHYPSQPVTVLISFSCCRKT